LGLIPQEGALDLSDLSIQKSEMEELFAINFHEITKEAEELKNYFAIFGEHLPQGVREELEALQQRLEESQKIRSQNAEVKKDCPGLWTKWTKVDFVD